MNIFRLLSAVLSVVVVTVYAEESATGIYESIPVDTVNVAGRGSGVIRPDGAVSNVDIPPPLDRLSTISVRCDVDEARVVINGKYLGMTPFIRHGFRPGMYEVELKKTGYISVTRMVRAAENDTVVIDCRLAPEQIATERAAPVPGTFRIEPPKGSATLLVTCSAESATVVVNKAKLGLTPFARSGFLPGYYEVEVKKGGYEAFSTMVHVNANDTARVKVALSSLFGRCIVASIPPDATVLFDGVQRGTTPIDSTGVRPGLYQVRIELPQYVPWTGQLTVARNRTDSIGIALMSIEKRDSLHNVSLRRFQMFRRVVFGAGTIGFFSAGLYYNGKVSQQLELEKTAWSRYQEANLSANEYDSRFASYQSLAGQTDEFINNRNASYIVGTIFAAGFAVSIPF